MVVGGRGTWIEVLDLWVTGPMRMVWYTEQVLEPERGVQYLGMSNVLLVVKSREIQSDWVGTNTKFRN